MARSRVIEALNLDVAAGEFIVLLGPSGCGKSTLLNAVAGLLDISEGEVWISGKNVTWAEPKDRGIGMVFQSYALYPRMSVAGNLSFGLRMAGLPKAEIAARVAGAAKLLQLEPLLDRRPSELSGGQRQRVAIGRALVRHVDVFLFDEPLSNLDAKLRNELRVEIKKLHQSLGNTMIYVTHDQIEALTLADRIAVMKNGVIQQLATPHDIYHRPVNLFVAAFIGSPGMNFVPGTIADGRFLASSEVSVALDRYPFDAPAGDEPGDARSAAGAYRAWRGARRPSWRARRRDDRRADGRRYGRLDELRRPAVHHPHRRRPRRHRRRGHRFPFRPGPCLDLRHGVR